MTKRIFSLALLLALLMTGCNKTWIDQMLSEMERETATAYYAKNREGRYNAATLVAQKYFKPGMSITEVTPLLNDLKSQGFGVREYRHEGARNWPDGKFYPYMDEGVRRNLQNQIPPGVSHISIRKEYGRTRIIIVKFIGMGFVIKDGEDKITDVEANLAQTVSLMRRETYYRKN